MRHEYCRGSQVRRQSASEIEEVSRQSVNASDTGAPLTPDLTATAEEINDVRRTDCVLDNCSLGRPRFSQEKLKQPAIFGAPEHPLERRSPKLLEPLLLCRWQRINLRADVGVHIA